MITKQQLYARLLASNAQEQKIIDSCNSLKDLKLELVHLVSKFETIRSQRANDSQYYLGDRFNCTPEYTDKVIDSVHNIAKKLNYKIYSPNGAWFIKNI